MKTKRSRKDYSEEDSDEPEQAWRQGNPDSDMFESSEEEVTKKSRKRKKKRDSSSESDTEDSDKESHKKRKHKKKKRKHSKKKRKDESSDDSESDSDASSDGSEEDSPVIVKKKHKHKHRHSGKHSKKHRRESEGNAYPEKVHVSEERQVPIKVSSAIKMKSVCMGKEPRPSCVENIVSSDDDHHRKRTVRREEPDQNAGRPEYNEEEAWPRHQARQQPRPQLTATARLQTKREPEPPQPPRSRDHYPSKPREEDRPREYPNKYQDSHNHYNRYGEGNGNKGAYDRNTGNKFHKDKFDEDPRDERYGGQSNSNYRGNRDNQGYDDRQDGYNNRRGNNYQQNYQRDNHRQDSNYEKGNDHHNARNEPRGNRYQDKREYTSGNQNMRRYDNRDENERKNPVKRELSASPSRDVKQERRPNSGRLGSRERSRTDAKREEREESGGGGSGRSRPTRFRSPQPRGRSKEEEKYEWGKQGPPASAAPEETKDKDKPNFGLSGKLTEDRNTVNGVVLKYSEPPEARQPKRRWRFYPFKGDKALAILYIHRQSAFLLGRDRKVADIPLDHPSVSKQHAALQYRLVPFTREDGSKGKRVRPYIIDLGSANGTFVNNKKIEASKYVELLERDVVKFGFSQREYVLLHENSKDDGMDDDDVKQSGGNSDEGKPHVKDENSN